MTDDTTTTTLPDDLAALEGETLWVQEPAGLTIVLREATEWNAIPKAVLVPRGGSIRLTAEILRASLDRTGKSWLTQGEDLQVLRYGHVRFSFEWPEHEQVLVPGSAEALEQGDRERARAWRTMVGPELVQALKGIDARLGRGGWKSTVVREDKRTDKQAADDALAQRRLMQAEIDAQNRAAVIGQQNITRPDGAA